MNSPMPQWTEELTTTFKSGEDHLGVDGAAQSYQQYLIPGIITITEHARYYSFYAWVLYRFINGGSRLLKDFKGTFFKRHEVALILGCYSHHPDESLGGLVGSGTNNYKARQMWESGERISLDADYFKDKLGGLGQYYRTAMQTMGLIAESEHPNWVYRLTSQGKELAVAYEKSIQETAYFKALKKRGPLERLSRDDAAEYGNMGCICPQALTHGADRELLRHAFFRFDQVGDVGNSHVRRRLSLGITLDLVHGARGKLEEYMIRRALYLGEYAPGRVYRPAKRLEKWSERWKMVEIRHMYSLGLQCLFAAFLLYLSQQNSGISFADWMDWAETQLPQGTAKSSGADFLNGRCHAVGLRGKWTGAIAAFGEACRQATALDEYSLFGQAYNGPSNAQVLLQRGFEILAQLFLRFLPRFRENKPEWKELAAEARLPISDYFAHVTECIEDPNWKVRDWLAWLYRDYILGQHEFIALEKLRFQRYDTFRFHYRDERFYWHSADPEDYREPIRLAALRVFMALTILTDLGLVQENAEGQFDLTADGDEYRQRILRLSLYAD